MKMSLFLQNTAGGILDAIIAALIVLLILSLINEKFVDLIRKYVKVPDILNPGQWMKAIGKGYTNDPKISERKTKQISLLAVLVGIIVATLSKASLFDLLFNENLGDSLFWADGMQINGSVFTFIVGILFTGFFLSFGSKFFHDLLDTLYQTKEYKRKLQSGQLLNRRNLKDLDEFISANSYQLAKKALTIHASALKEQYGDLISNIEIGNTADNQIGLIVNVKASPPSGFPSALPVELPSGGNIMIPVEVDIDEIGEIHYGLRFRVQNPDDAGRTGALGGILVSHKNGKTKFLLTCSHVVLGGRSTNLGGFSEGTGFGITTEVLEKNEKRNVGDLIYAKLDDVNDTAIVELTGDPEGWNNELPDGNVFGEAIAPDMLELTEEVRFFSSVKQKEISGSIHKLRTKKAIRLRYGDLKVKTFSGLVVLGTNKNGLWTPMSQKGDSGSIVYDENHSPFAMIIGGGSKYTYALPLVSILEATNTEIFV